MIEKEKLLHGIFVDVANLPIKTTKRIIFHEITKAAI